MKIQLIEPFSSIDNHFARFICRLSGASPEEGLEAAARLVSHHTRLGSTCIDLSDLSGKTLVVESTKERIDCPGYSTWLQELEGSRCVGAPGEASPLILDPPFLYLKRYWAYEKSVARFVLERCGFKWPSISQDRLKGPFNRLFPARARETDWQAVAALSTLGSRISIINGGPGTGKTTTVVKILALFMEIFGDKDLKILLAAPTGKAASRLSTAILKGKKHLKSPRHVIDRIPSDAVTIHRLLGAGRRRIFFNKDNPLYADLVVIDEASMVDLPLMAHLMEAIPPGCRLILLGDMDQLTSVQPGSVFSDICRAGSNAFSMAFIKMAKIFTYTADMTIAEEDALLQDNITTLVKNYRFDEGSPIQRLSTLIRERDHEKAMEVISSARKEQLSWKDPSHRPLRETTRELVETIHRHYLQFMTEMDPEKALSAMGKLGVLCAARSGPFGAEGINYMVEQRFLKEHPTGHTAYPGRPVMVTVNDYNRMLFNGDTGVILNQNSELWAFFQGEKEIRRFSIADLPEHQSAYAITVHKSQGSEFDTVVLVLPERINPVLSRQLIYTAITRARRRLEIWGAREVLTHALKSATVRTSGLKARLSTWHESKVH